MADANTRLLAARAYFKVGDHESALAEVAKAIYFKDDLPELYLLRAAVYEDYGDLQSTLVNLRKALSLRDDFPIRMRAVTNLELGAVDDAILYSSQAIEIDDLNAAFFLHRALAHCAKQDWKAAAPDLDRCVTLQPDSADLLVLRAKARWLLGLEQMGNQDIRRAYAVDPSHAEVMAFEQSLWSRAERAFGRASAAMLQGSFADAITHLDEALEYSPNDIKSLALRASAKRSMKRFSEALADLDLATELFRQLQRRRAVEAAMADTSLPAAAAAATAAATAAAGSSAILNRTRSGTGLSSAPYSVRSGAASGAGEEDGAILMDHPEIQRQRCLLLNDMALERMAGKDLVGALALFNRIVDMESSSSSSAEAATPFVDPRFYVNRGDCHRAMGNMQEAIADYHKAYDAMPDDWDVRTRLAVVHEAFGRELFNQGEYSHAEMEFTLAVQHNPKIARVYYGRARCAFLQQRFRPAHEDLQRALALDSACEGAALLMSQFSALPPAAASPARGASAGAGVGGRSPLAAGRGRRGSPARGQERGSPAPLRLPKLPRR